MKLQKFIKNKKQKQIFIGAITGIIVLIGGITLYRTFALYKAEKSFDVIKGIVPDFSSGDVTLAFTVNKKTESGVAFPNKNEGFKVDGVTCENNVLASWDEDNWALKIENSNKNSRIKCTINFKRYEESILNGAYPVLKEGLVPVKIDETTGAVTKANIEENWYEYGQKKWANAVILVDGKTEANYKEGQTIPETDIESYFVWIPKYKYKIFDMGKYDKLEASIQDKGANTLIEIEFGLENTKDDDSNPNYKECATPNKSGADGQCDVDKWMTHPAFTAFEGSKGMWVGKFETGYQGASNTIDAQKDTNEPEKVIIKPNVYSWRNIKIGNAFNTSYEYERKLDSHMMKNTEWGAVAYLTQSIYGRCNNDTKTCEEVRMNNSSSYVTGYAAKEAPITGYDAYKDYGAVNPGNDANANSDFKGAYNYTTKESNMASTTKNYTGIYDMSGGAWEYTVGYISSNSLDSVLPIEGITDLKYIDLYAARTFTQFDRRILGDATGELGPFLGKKYNAADTTISSWYEDYGVYATTDLYWFLRGGQYLYGTCAGVFASTRRNGEAWNFASFRIVLAPL